MARRKSEEIPYYDWLPGKEGDVLIYQGRKPNRIDAGVIRMFKGTEQDPLYLLYKKGKLVGTALEEAERLFISRS